MLGKMLNLSDLKLLKEAFATFYSDGAKLSIYEFQQLLEQNSRLTNPQIQLLFFLVESDQNGCIDFKKIFALIRPTYKVDDKLFVKNLFSYLDQEKKGAINFQDFQRVSVLFDDDLEEAELKEYFDEFKKNASKRVTFNEFEKNQSIKLLNRYFIKFMSKLINHLTNETYKVFEELDDDTDGNLNFEDFKKLTHNQNFKECSESYLKKIYAKADVNNDSKISFDEFCDMVYELTLSDDEDDDEYEDKTEDETDDDLGDSNKYQAYKVKKQLSTLKE